MSGNHSRFREGNFFSQTKIFEFHLDEFLNLSNFIFFEAEELSSFFNLSNQSRITNVASFIATQNKKITEWFKVYIQIFTHLIQCYCNIGIWQQGGIQIIRDTLGRGKTKRHMRCFYGL